MEGTNNTMKLFNFFRIYKGAAYLLLVFGLAFSIFALQERADHNACHARNDLRNQVNQIIVNDRNLRDEFVHFLRLRLSGDQNLIAENISGLEQSIKRSEAIETDTLKLENCPSFFHIDQ